MNDKNFHCEVQNMGTVRLFFTNPAYRYQVAIFNAAGYVREKNLAPGQLEDTLQLDAGYHTITATGRSSGNDVPDSTLHTLNVEQCREHALRHDW